MSVNDQDEVLPRRLDQQLQEMLEGNVTVTVSIRSGSAESAEEN